MGDWDVEEIFRDDRFIIDQPYTATGCGGINAKDFHFQIPITKFPAYRQAGKSQIITNDQISIARISLKNLDIGYSFSPSGRGVYLIIGACPAPY
jgi:hypothetical protein